MFDRYTKLPSAREMEARMEAAKRRPQEIIDFRKKNWSIDGAPTRASAPKTAQPKPDAEGWIKHDRSKRCPIPKDARFQYRDSAFGDTIFPVGGRPTALPDYHNWEFVTEYRIVEHSGFPGGDRGRM